MASGIKFDTTRKSCATADPTNTADTKLLYICPNCNALCEEGNDEEFQVQCGNCKRSFGSHKAKQVRLENKYLNSHFRRVSHASFGWSSYVPVDE